MDRKEYLDRCQKCAALLQGVGGLKQHVPPCLRVLHKKREYYPAAYQMAFGEHGYPIHTAVLHELDELRIKYVPLDRVEAVKEAEDCKTCDKKKADSSTSL